ncbi:MAG: S8 family peptidase [Bacteroidales bacterium]
MKIVSKKFPVSMLLIGSCFLLHTLAFGQNVSPNYEDGGVYIKFKNESGFKAKSTDRLSVQHIPTLKSSIATYGIQEKVESMALFNNSALEQTISITIDSIYKIDEFIEKLSKNPDIDYIEKRPIYYIASLPTKMESKEGTFPNDPLYGIINGVNLSWHLDMLHAQEAWKEQSGKANIKVAVVDNAIWGAHPDLKIDSINQYNLAKQAVGNSAPPISVNADQLCNDINNCPNYNWSHGTHCAGAIGAINNNSIGIASMGSGVTLMGVSCPAPNASGLEVRNGFAGVAWAAEHGANVISLSWGGYNAPAQTEANIIKTCIDAGIIIVAASGNNSFQSNFYPADLPNVISVSSVDSDKKLSAFSNYGDWVDVACPGGFVVSNGNPTFNSIFSTTFCSNQAYRLKGVSFLNGQNYDGMYGTSMATPIVAGLCGFLLSYDSTISPAFMRELLMASSQSIVADKLNKNIRANSGIVDAAAALQLLKNHLPMPTNPKIAYPQQNIIFSWEAPLSAPLTLDYYQVYRNGKLVADHYKTTTYTDSSMSEGVYEYGVAAVYTNGKISLKAGITFSMPVFQTLKAMISPKEAGYVEGAGKFAINSEVTVVAHPNPNYVFSKWTEYSTFLTKDSAYTLTLDKDYTLLATFLSTTPNETLSSVEKRLKIHPNPSISNLYIASELDQIKRIEICNLQGQILYEKSGLSLSTSATEAYEINTAFLSTGLYLIRAYTSKGVYTAKFNKQ